MKLRSVFLPLATIALGSFSSLAQAQTQGSCATDEMRQRLIAQNPDLLRQEAEYEHGLQAYLQAKAGQRTDTDTITYVIPVVFHILYDPSFQENSPSSSVDAHNISNAQIFDQMSILNRDYAKLNADTTEICCGFITRAANIHVKFELATKDPFGNCTNGIDRITTQRSSNAGDYSKLNSWFRDRYLNVWSVRSFAALDGGIAPAGYSQYPSDVQDAYGALRDGVILLDDYLGSTGTSSVFHSRDLTHEVGHYLNLQHPWGNNNGAGVACGDDGVDDTPITKGWLYCPDPASS
ncbi:MAG: M43 family zinc metalloprotease, partial [Flavobacteriales bacterium]